ncbi:hypothetical protein CFN78_08760 [Amycolatopsis antarctica]|uniref:Uncharacterized protein n=2 Tax=Amycolatopsis antarctica TaxID=1854586 RepID=A0A263D5Y8_9PSEU|nr:hypothetical protein CFN78_08760 [Amycolatopsis antarctica]
MPNHPAHAMPPQRESGVTAIIAGVLAVVGGLFHLLGIFLQFADADVIFDEVYGVVAFISNIVLVLTLLPGAVLLFTRKPAGRLLVMGGAAFAVVYFVGGLVWGLASTLPSTSLTSSQAGAVAGATGTILLVFMVPAIATFVLAIVPPTVRWIAAARAPQAGGYAQSQPLQPPPGYPQQPQSW